MFTKSLASACAIALFAAAPLAASAMASPKPMMMGSSHMTHQSTMHQCRNAKGQFVKGKYLKCPAGTHKAM
jgi:hypothetical protein